MYCGGLPQKPEGELRHALFFDAKGLYNECAELPKVIQDGVVATLPALRAECFKIFAYQQFSEILESALTHGAFSADPKLWENVQNISYATLRYLGHFRKIREMIAALPREECIRQMKAKMSLAGKDLVILRVEAIGTVGIFSKAEYDYELIDFYDEKTGLSAMQRCTAFPATETILQILTGNWPKGVVYHEPHLNMTAMIDNLAKHNVNIRSSMYVLK